MEEAIRTKLLATAALTALVGNRIDWGVRPQGSALPGIALFQISGVPQMNLAGPGAWSRDRIQIDCWGRTFAAARNVADVIGKRQIGVLVGFRGDLSGLRVRTFVIGRRSSSDSDSAGPIHCSSIDVTVWHAPA